MRKLSHPLLRSLKARILMAALFIILFGMWSLSFLASRMLRDDMERVLGDQQRSTVTLIATQIDKEIDTFTRALQRANTLAVRAIRRDSATVQQFVDERINLQAIFNGGIVVVDAKGRLIADSAHQSLRPEAQITDNDAIALALQSGKPAISRPLRGQSSNTPSFAIVVPILGERNEILGALAGFTEIDEASFLAPISRNRYGKTGHYMLIDPIHRLIITGTAKRQEMAPTPPPGTFPDIDAVISGQASSAVLLDPDGNEVLISARRIPTTGWMVVADLPTDEAFEPIREMQRQMLLITGLLSLLSMVLISWLLKRQLAPLESTAALLASLPEDRLPSEALPVEHEDEVGELIRHFNQVLDAFRQRESALRESEERFKVLHNASFGGIAIHDRGTIIDCNQGLAELTGYRKEELIGSDVFDLIAPEAREALRQLALSGDETPSETLGVRKDGSTYPISRFGKNIHYKGKSIRVTEFRDISERKRAENALRRSEESFRNFFEKNSSIMLLTNPFSGDIIDANETACAYYGYSKTAMLAMNISAINALDPARIAEQRRRALFGECKTFNFSHRLASGELRDVEAHISPIDGEDGPVLFSIIHDFTERKRANEKLQLAASVFSHAREGILITRADGSIIDTNDAFTRITGYTREEVIGKNPKILNSGRQGREFFAGLWEALQHKGHWYGEIWNRRKNGEIYAALQTISTVFDAQHVAQHHVALFSDITALKEHAKQLEHIAHYDVLTTLPNRVLLADRMKQAMAHADRRGQRLAVAYLDLDGFKAINDRHGHEAGDRLLIALAERMKQSLREGDTLARLGGDEFIAVLMDLSSPATSRPLLTRMLEAAATPINIGNLELRVSASLGVTFYPQSEEVDADQLLRQADQAMYQAKLAGKNRYHLFDAEQDRNVRGHHESIEHIRRGLEANEFVLYYQPKVNMRTGLVIGAEALIRWQHPEHGLLAPSVFLPVIEDHPLAIELGEWTIEQALTQIERWQTQGSAIPVSVNVGGRQLLHGDFARRVREALDHHPEVSPNQLEIEVLETSALEDLAHVSQIIEDCQHMGVSFALDDFGTGYSSLTYLKRLAVNQLKIDQSFVRDMLDDPDDLSILGGVLNMASAFRRQVIAEGVETVAHGTMLLQLGCELAQGYGIARPMPPEDMPGWIAAWRPEESWSRMQPARRDDLPLLFAGVEHRAWIAAVEDFLRGRRLALPLAHHQCRFSAWLDNEGRSRHANHPAFSAVIDLHENIHHFANQLCKDGATPQDEALEPQLHRLNTLRDTLLEQLQSLITAPE